MRLGHSTHQMPNSPRPENRHRMVRVEDELWRAAGEACRQLGTTRSEIMREALRRVVADAECHSQT